MKRALVPTALHRELVEYASLVRVLRTARALDLTTHLVKHAAQHDVVDTWTAWPLIDCPVPEWSLADEIEQLAAFASGEKYSTDVLVHHAGAVLVHILNLLADQRPAAPGSMQNRLWQMNWEDVISLVAVSGVLDPAIVTRAEKRLERVYGPSSTKAIERLNRAASGKTRFASLTPVDEDLLLAPPVLPRARRSDGKGRHRSGVKSNAMIDTDSDADHDP